MVGRCGGFECEFVSGEEGKWLSIGLNSGGDGGSAGLMVARQAP